MPAIKFTGNVLDASGAAIILSVASPSFQFSDTFTGTFSKTLNLPGGNYSVIVNAFTDGEVEFDIKGNFTSVNPEVPETFDKDKQGNIYTLTV